jgi:hypothetical protein
MRLALVLILFIPALACAADARKPVLVELFTSEGCSSCPPAEGMLAAYAKSQPFEGVQIIPLAWHVDYFNNPWVDPYSSKQATARQREYVDRFGLRSCYTPQVVVDGAAEFVGGEKPAFADAMANAAKNIKGSMQLTVEKTDKADAIRVKVAATKLPQVDASDTVEVFVAIAENGLINAAKRGENGGSKLRHSAVVRLSRKVGQVDPKSPDQFTGETTLQLSPDWKRDQLQVLAFSQALRSGRITSVGSQSLPKE